MWSKEIRKVEKGEEGKKTEKPISSGSIDLCACPSKSERMLSFGIDWS